MVEEAGRDHGPHRPERVHLPSQLRVDRNWTVDEQTPVAEADDRHPCSGLEAPELLGARYGPEILGEGLELSGHGVAR